MLKLIKLSILLFLCDLMQASYEVALHMKEENFYVFLLVEFSSKEFKQKESPTIASEESLMIAGGVPRDHR